MLAGTLANVWSLTNLTNMPPVGATSVRVTVPVELAPLYAQMLEANGYEVSARGRIKKEVIDAYDEAHK